MVGLFPDSQRQLTHHNRTGDKWGHMPWLGGGSVLWQFFIQLMSIFLEIKQFDSGLSVPVDGFS